MAETVALQQNNVYGAFELKKIYSRNYAIGVGLAIFLHLLLIGAYWFSQVLAREDESGTPTVRMKINYSDLGPPPSIENVAPQIQVAGPVAAPTVGIPVPVPDEEAPPEQVIASQTELSAQQAPALAEDLTGGGAQITQDIKIEEEKPTKEDEPDMNSFVAVEKLPEMVFAAKPEYPEIAKRAGITGKVFVKVLIDKQGKPKKAVVIKSDSELFNQAAIDAAMKSAFSPALQNQHPISVWIVLPYRFTLEGQQ